MLRIDTFNFELLMSNIFDHFYAQNNHVLFRTFDEWHIYQFYAQNSHNLAISHFDE